MTPSAAAPPAALAERLAAPVFVLLWSTGFIGAKLGLPHAEPMTFLTVRFALVVAGLALWIRLAGLAWPGRGQVADQAGIGILLHGGYLGGVFAAISLGTEAGVAALIVGLQPIATTLIARRVLGERLAAAQWVGMALGFAGVGLVVGQKLGAGAGDWRGVAFCGLALLAIAAGSVWQKLRGGTTPVQGGALVQFAAAGVVTGALALALETREVDWTGEFVFALGWLVLVLSLGAMSLLIWLIRQGAASNVASLFFLVPPCTALVAWALFGERLGPVALAGVATASLGVWMVNRPAPFARAVSRARRVLRGRA